MSDILLKTASNTLSKALTANSTNAGFTPFYSQNAVPEPAFRAGHLGLYAPNRVAIYPYCEGPEGATFSVRVYGWNNIGNDPRYAVHTPALLAELLCTSCNQTGPQNPATGASFLLILDSERFCDTITLTQGGVGWMGEVCACPGSGCIGFAMIDLRGAKYFSFDFAQGDPVSMNALFATA